VGGQEDRRAQRAQRANQLPGGPACRRVEAGRRLVEEDEVGVADEGDPEVEATLLAAGQGLHTGVALLSEPDEVDDLVHVAGPLVVAGEEAVHLAHGQERAQLGLLQDDADPFPQRARGRARVVPEDDGVAAVPVPVPLEDLDRGRLPGTVRPEEAEDLSLCHREAHTAERCDGSIRLREVGDDDRVRHGTRRYASRGRG
jgi:hypothetical protein